MSNTIESIEGNKKIGVFMGKTIVGDWVQLNDAYKGEYNTCLLKYDKDWNGLMAVVQKIEKDFSNEFEVIIYSASCYIHKWNAEKEKFDSFIFGTGKKIEAVYNAVIEFIEWYNNQKPNQ